MKHSLVISGPTGVGKTKISQIVAEKLDGEIISADSRQVYRGLDIGTAKPVSPKITHHLIDIIEPTERYDAASFVRDSLEIMEKLHNEGKVPIIVGGTGLYIRALTEGIFTGNFRDVKIRKSLKARWNAGDNLYVELKKIDPIAAKNIDPRNYVRIERAIEVFMISGKPISYWWENKTNKSSDWFFLKIVLTLDRSVLYSNIENRTMQMIQQGWIEEVKRLIDSGIPKNSSGLSSIGYRQIISYLNGEISQDEMIKEIIKETKQYARKQLIWFRKEPNVHWVDIYNERESQIANEIIGIWQK
jgi:tRNA dimethylallyltransferase